MQQGRTNTTVQVNGSPPSGSRRRRPLGHLGRGILRRFALYAALSVVLVAIISGYLVWREVSDAQALQQQMAGWIAGQLDTWLLEVENELTEVAQYPGLMQLPADDLTYRLRQVMDRNPALFSLSLVQVDPGSGQGHELVRVGSGSTWTGTDPSSEPWFQSGLEHGNQVLPIVYGETGMPVVRFAWTVRENGQLVGMILAEAQLSWAYGMLEQMQALQAGSSIYLVDEQGRPLLHEQGSFVFSHQPQTDVPGIRAALDRQHVPLTYPGLNPQRELVVGGYGPVLRATWFVFAEQPLIWTLRGLSLVGVGLIAALLLSIGAATVVGLYITRRVAQPIARLSEGAQRIGAGELQHRIVLAGRDELADLAEEFNHMTARVESLVADLLQRNVRLQGAVQQYVAHMTEVGRGHLAARLSLDPSPAEEEPLHLLGVSLNTTTADLQRMIAQVGAAAGQLGAAVAAIVSATIQQASGAQEQSAALGQVSATIQEVYAVAEQMAHRARGVAEMAQQTAAVSRAGQQAVTDAIAGMEQVRQRVEGLALNIVALAEQTQIIGQIVTEVSGIAVRSNLLALNAAVEAARAGEAGKGFAVVAGEMRNLAVQSRAATTRVTELLTGVQQAVDAAVTSTDEGRKGTVLGVQLTGEAGESIRQLAESVNESAQAAEQIASAAGQQLTGLEQIVVAMDNVRQVTTVNVSEAQHLEQTATELRDLAEQLRKSVAAYQL